MTTMTDFTATLSAAICESLHRNRTVDITVHNDEELDAVICQAEDSIDLWDDGTLDVWGTTDSGHEWRLCVKIAY